MAHLHSERIAAFLDAGSGACWMKDSHIAQMVANTLAFFNGKRYHLHAWCVMPNHVHVLVEPLAGHRLPDIVQSWKSFTAKTANKLLDRSGDFWQPEYYDHLLRDAEDYAHAVWYVEQNPLTAGLYEWQWVSRSTGVSPVNTAEHRRDARAPRTP